MTNEQRKYTAEEIAQWFINRSALDAMQNKGENLSNMKLQKLLYYAQGCYLAIKDKPLFEDAILAWEHGPVIEKLYHKYKKKLAINDTSDVNIDKETTAILEEVYKVFGKYSAWMLRDMTHREDTWLKTLQGEEIQQDLISKYFKTKWVTSAI